MISESSMTLGTDYAGQRVIGWLATEKVEDVRAYWDGSALWTREGNRIEAPAWFTDGLPKGFALDGGAWCGRGRFEEARAAVQYGRWTRACRFAVFDAPGVVGGYPERLAAARGRLLASPHAFTVEAKPIRSRSALASMLADVLNGDGEGLMLRNPAVIRYEHGRTKNLLKLKSRLQLCYS